MSKSLTSLFNHWSIKQLLWIGGLIVLLGFVLPMTALASDPVPPGAEKCIGCHPDQTESWQDSPHAEAILDDENLRGIMCESCHGTYVVDHPNESAIQELTIDSSVCQECHNNTFEQWEHSTHAQAGVQCIGCHLAHTLEFRIAEEALCHSCHLDRYEYYSSTPHSNIGLTCADCHFPSTPISELVFNSEDCSSCHEGSVHQTLGTLHQANTVPVSSASMQPVTQPDNSSEQMTCLGSAQQTDESARQTDEPLPTMSLVSLGLGIGIGGMLGIIFMQFVGYMNLVRVKR